MTIHRTQPNDRNLSRRGLTLFEILVVLGLVMILTTVTAVYNKGVERQIVVLREHAKIIGMLTKARTAGLAVPKAAPGELICGLGVHIDQASRTLTYFKDLGAADCSTADHVFTGASEQIDRIILSDRIRFTTVGFSDVVFMPPSGAVIIDNDPAKVSATVQITGINIDLPKAVKVNIYGQITETPAS